MPFDTIRKGTCGTTPARRILRSTSMLQVGFRCNLWTRLAIAAPSAGGVLFRTDKRQMVETPGKAIAPANATLTSRSALGGGAFDAFRQQASMAEPPAGTGERVRLVGGEALALSSGERRGQRTGDGLATKRVLLFVINLVFSALCSYASSGMAFGHSDCAPGCAVLESSAIAALPAHGHRAGFRGTRERGRQAAPSPPGDSCRADSEPRAEGGRRA
jgi:hypothetical protein